MQYRKSFLRAIRDNLSKEDLDTLFKPLPSPDIGDFRGAMELSGRTGFDAAEIGVHKGFLSQFILTHLPGLCTLFMVDPWKEWGDDERYRTAGHRIVHEDQEANFQEASANVADFADRRRVLRDVSVEAAKEVADGSLTFVFIDGDHSYEGCKEDLHAWYKKVKPGGLLMGHDYGRRKWGVAKAVNEFTDAEGLELQVYPKSVWTCRIPA